MAETLRPMSTGELLDRTFSLYRRNFILFAGVSALAPAIYTAIQLAVTGIGLVAARPGSAAAGAGVGVAVATASGVLVGVVAWMIGLALTYAATIVTVAAVHLGRPITIGGAYSALKGQYGRIFGVFLSVAIRVGGGTMILVIAAVMIGSFAAVGGSTLGTAGIIGGSVLALVVAVAAALLAVTLFVRYSLAVQACVVENVTVRESLKRSVFLSKGARGRILTVYTIFILLTWVITYALILPTAALGSALGPGMLATALVLLAGFVAGALTGPFVTIGMSLLYYDERVRKEAFDLQLMMASLTPAGQAAAATSSAG